MCTMLLIHFQTKLSNRKYIYQYIKSIRIESEVEIIINSLFLYDKKKVEFYKTSNIPVSLK